MKAVAFTVAAVILVVSGVTIALVAGSGGHSSTVTAASQQSGGSVPGARSDVAAAAAYLGITPAALRRELRAGKTLAQVAAATPGKSTAGLVEALVAAKGARLRAAVEAGKVPAAQQAQRLARIRARAATELNRISAAAGGLGVGGYGLAASSYLGISRSQLRAELRSGRTLAQIAAATGGRSANGLIAALVENRKAKLAAETATGKLTAQKEAKRLSTLNRRVTVAVNRVPAAPSGGSASPAGGQGSGEGEAAEAEASEG